MESLAGSIGYDNGYVVSSQGRSGGLGLFWNNPIKLEILGYSVYHIDCSVEKPGSDSWRMTLFYGEEQTPEVPVLGHIEGDQYFEQPLVRLHR